MSNATEQFEKYFQVLLDSIDARARVQAREKLLEIDEEILVGLLDKVIKNETNTEVLAYAAELVVNSKYKQRANLILPLLQNKDPILRRHLCGLLGSCGDQIAVTALVHRLQLDSSADVRVIAAYALGKIRDKQALPFLIWAKNHDFSADCEGKTVSEEANHAINEIEKNRSGK